MIDRDTKRTVGQMVKGVQVVAEGRAGSWWVKPDSVARLVTEGGSG